MEPENSQLEREPFVQYNDRDEKPKSDTFNVRMGKKYLSRDDLEWLKEALDVRGDSTALKIAAMVGKNVLQNHFGKPILQYLFKKDRDRLSDERSF